MRKHNQIHTLGAPHYKALFTSLSKLKHFKCALWSKTYGMKIVNLVKYLHYQIKYADVKQTTQTLFINM